MIDPSHRVSVIIPCHNYGRFLAEAIESCLRQTLPPHEILVMDDGSEDDTRSVAARYSHRVKYMWQPNAGLPAVRNAGIKQVTGDFIVFLDADDMLCDSYLERCADALTASPADTAYAYTPVRFFGRSTGTSRASPYSSRTLRYSNYVNASAMIRRDVFARFAYSEDLPVLEDFDLYLTMAEQGLGGVRVPEPLLLYRRHHSMTDRLNDRWSSVERTVMERHPSLYPRRVRLAVAIFRLADRIPLLSRAVWVLRGSFRERVSKQGR